MKELSIITINYNNSSGLAETFASVFCQTFSGFEYIVIDGGSTDGSADLMEEHAGKITYRVSEKDKGIYDAMNKGIAAASGEYLIFLNSGDCFVDAGTLDECMRCVSNHPAADILYGDIYLISGPPSEPEPYTHPATLQLRYFKNHVLNQQASLIRSRLFKEFGNFPAQYRLAGDYWLYMKSFLAGKTFVHMNFIMICYDFTGLSFSSGDVYIAERNDIWKKLVPEPMRRTIDRYEEFKKSRIGGAFLRLISRFTCSG